MKGIFSKIIIGLAVLCAVGSVRPASAQTFDQQLAALRANITGPWANCFQCQGGQTILNLLNGAQAAHNAGNTALCISTINMAITCANTPSRDIYRIALFVDSPRNAFINGTGTNTPISVLISYLAGLGTADNLPGPVYPVFKFFDYQSGGFIDLVRYDACRTEAHDVLILGLQTLLALC